MSKYQQSMLSLASRILSDLCESVSVMTFNGEKKERQSLRPLPFAVRIKALGSPSPSPNSEHNTNIVQTGPP